MRTLLPAATWRRVTQVVTHETKKPAKAGYEEKQEGKGGKGVKS
jgi:hypothetical protein